RLLEAVIGRRVHLHAFDDQRRAVFQQRGILFGRDRGERLQEGGQDYATQREFLPVVRVDLQRRLEFPESIAAGTQHDRQLVVSRRHIELVLVAIGPLGE